DSDARAHGNSAASTAACLCRTRRFTGFRALAQGVFREVPTFKRDNGFRAHCPELGGGAQAGSGRNGTGGRGRWFPEHRRKWGQWVGSSCCGPGRGNSPGVPRSGLQNGLCLVWSTGGPTWRPSGKVPCRDGPMRGADSGRLRPERRHGRGSGGSTRFLARQFCRRQVLRNARFLA
ncbi:MAG: hypothetical protein ACI84E_001895, partial [Planctomycetota bacterium]